MHHRAPYFNIFQGSPVPPCIKKSDVEKTNIRQFVWHRPKCFAYTEIVVSKIWAYHENLFSTMSLLSTWKPHTLCLRERDTCFDVSLNNKNKCWKYICCWQMNIMFLNYYFSSLLLFFITSIYEHCIISQITFTPYLLSHYIIQLVSVQFN